MSKQLSAPSPSLKTIFTSKATSPDEYTITFYLKVPLSTGSSPANYLCDSAWTQDSLFAFLAIYSDGNNVFLVSQGLKFFVFPYNIQASEFETGSWIHVVLKYSLGIGYLQALLIESTSAAPLMTDSYQLGGSNIYSYQGSRNLQYGCHLMAPTTSQRIGISIREFQYIEKFMSSNDIIYASRNPLIYANMTDGSKTFRQLSEGKGVFTRNRWDALDYIEIRGALTESPSQESNLFWAWDPKSPLRVCDEEFEVYNTEIFMCTEQKALYFSSDQQSITLERLSSIPTVTIADEFSICMFLLLEVMPDGAKKIFMILNPTVSDLESKIYIFVQTDQATLNLRFVVKQVDNLEYTSQVAQNYKNTWGYFCLIKAQSSIYYTLNEQQQRVDFPLNDHVLNDPGLAQPWLMTMDGKIQFGGTSVSDYPTVAAQNFRLSHVLYIPQELSTAQIREARMKRRSFLTNADGSTLHLNYYFPLTDAVKQSYQIYNRGFGNLFTTDFTIPVVIYPNEEPFSLYAKSLKWDTEKYSNLYNQDTPIYSGLVVPQQIDDWTIQVYFRSRDVNSGFKTIFYWPSWINLYLDCDAVTIVYIFKNANDSPQSTHSSQAGLYQFDQWTHLTLTFDSAQLPNQLTLYINGVYQETYFGKGVPIRAATVPAIHTEIGPTTYISQAELRVWQGALNPLFIKTTFSKKLDGTKYANLFFYFDPQITNSYADSARVCLQGSCQDYFCPPVARDYTTPSLLCDKNTIWNGRVCKTEYYLHFKKGQMRSVEIKVESKPNDATIEFWILLNPVTAAGNILSFPVALNTILAVNDFSLTQLSADCYVSTSLTQNQVSLSYRDVQTLSLTNWKKLVITLSKSGQLVTIYSAKTIILQFVLSVELTYLRSITLCDVQYDSGTGCDFVISHLAVWNAMRDYTARESEELFSKPFPFDLFTNYYPLIADSRDEFYLYDLSSSRTIKPSGYQVSFVWVTIDEFSSTEGPLILCGEGQQINLDTMECFNIVVEQRMFTITNTAPVKLSQQTQFPYGLEWTIEFWFKIASRSNGADLTINMLDSVSTCAAPANKTKTKFQVQRINKVHFLLTKLGNLNIPSGSSGQFLNATLTNGKGWNHAYLKNGRSQTAISGLNFQELLFSGQAYPLAQCTLTIGNSPTTNTEEFFMLRELRIWNVELSTIALMRNYNKRLPTNTPDLIKYYPFSTRLMTDIVNNFSNKGQGEANLLTTYDPTFNFACPVGISYNIEFNMCELQRPAVGFDIGSGNILNLRAGLQPMFLERDFRFTLTMVTQGVFEGEHTIIPGLFQITQSAGLTMTVRFFGNSSISAGTLPAQFDITEVNQPHKWAIQFDLCEKRLIKVYLNGILRYQQSVHAEDFPVPTNQLDYSLYLRKYSSIASGSGSLFVKQVQLHYPILSDNELSNLNHYSVHSAFKSKAGLLAYFDFHNSSYIAHQLYDVKRDSLSETTVQNQNGVTQGTIEAVCEYGYRFQYPNLCLPSMALTIKQKATSPTLKLTYGNSRLGSSFTLMGWFNILQTPPNGSTILFFHLSMITAVFYNSASLILYGPSGNLGSLTVTLPLNVWQHVAIVFSGGNLQVSLNSIEIFNKIAGVLTFQDQDISEIQVDAKLAFIQARDIALFTVAMHSKLLLDLMHSEINVGLWGRDLIAYYRLNIGHVYGLLYDSSVYSRSSTYDSTSGDYAWDYDFASSPVGLDLSKYEGQAGFQSKDKSLIFTKETLIGNINAQLTQNYTVSFCFWFNQDPATFAFVNTYLLKVPGIFQFYFTPESKVGLIPDLDFPSAGPELNSAFKTLYWHCIAGGQYRSPSAAIKAFALNPQHSEYLTPDGKMYTSTSAVKIYAVSSQIYINGFFCSVREVKIWPYAMTSGMIIGNNLHRRIPNLLYQKIVAYIRLDEGAGNRLMQAPSMLSTTVDEGLLWQTLDPLVLCEGRSKYSPQGYCLGEERFLKTEGMVKPFTYTIGDRGLYNSTTAGWFNMKDISTYVALELSQRYNVLLGADKSFTLQICDQVAPNDCNQPLNAPINKEGVFNNGHDNSQWVFIAWRINYFAQYISAYKYYLNYQNSLQVQGSVSSQYKVQYTSEGLRTVSLNQPQVGSTPNFLWLRMYQLWSEPISFSLIKRQGFMRNFYTIDLSSIHLVLMLKLDESAGTVLANTAQGRMFNVANFDTNANSQWRYFVDAFGEETLNDNLRQVMMLEPFATELTQHINYDTGCSTLNPNNPQWVFNGCSSPNLDNLLLCNQPQEMVLDSANKVCYDLSPLCKTGTIANANLGCTSCYDPMILVDGKCLQDCPPGTVLSSSNTCVACSNPLCHCNHDNLGECLGCIDETIIYDAKNKKCLVSCPDGTYLDTKAKACLKCHSMCSLCFGPSNRECSACIEEYLYVPQITKCIELICEEPYQVRSNQSLTCLPCEHPCYTCMDSPNYCLSCADTYELDPATHTCTDCDSNDVGLSLPFSYFPGGQLGGYCTEICGDGIMNIKHQSILPAKVIKHNCDDDNLLSRDGCTDRCQLENSYAWRSTPLKAGILQNEEVYDNLGPSFEIIDISLNNKVLTLKADQMAFTESQSLTSNDFSIIIRQKETGDTQLYQTGYSEPITGEFKKKKMLKLYLEHNTQVPYKGASLVQILFHDELLFVDAFGNPMQVRTNTFKLNRRIAYDPGMSAMISQIGQDAVTATLASLSSNAFLTMLLGESMGPVFDAINSLQILQYLPLIACDFPPNMMQVYTQYFKYLNLEPSSGEDPIKTYLVDESEVKDGALNARFEDTGISTCLLLFAFTARFDLWLKLLMAYPAIVFLQYFLQRSRVGQHLARRFKILFKLGEVSSKLEASYRYQTLYKIVQEMYLELALYSILNMRNIQWENKSQLVVTIVGFIGAFFAIYTPVLVQQILVNNWNQFWNEEWLRRNGSLIEDTRLEYGKIMNQLFLSIFYFRRLLYVGILVFLVDYPFLQLTFCVLKTVGVLYFIIERVPFDTPLKNSLSILEEIFNVLAFAYSFKFIRTSSEPMYDTLQTTDERYQGWIKDGWMMIALAVSTLGVRLGVVLVRSVIQVVKIIKALKDRGLRQKIKDAFTVEVPPEKILEEKVIPKTKDLDQTRKEPRSVQMEESNSQDVSMAEQNLLYGDHSRQVSLSLSVILEEEEIKEEIKMQTPNFKVLQIASSLEPIEEVQSVSSSIKSLKELQTSQQEPSKMMPKHLGGIYRAPIEDDDLIEVSIKKLGKVARVKRPREQQIFRQL